MNSLNQSAGLVIENLRKTFAQGGRRLVALSGVDLTVHPGEFVVVVGSSGCGKSTLLRIVAGLESGDEGVVSVGGRLIRGTSRDRGVVFQEHRLFPWLTVQQNVAFGLAEIPQAERRRSVEEHLALVGLTGFENAYPHQLSGGMAQRVAIARALAVRPQLLLLDEPFGALDYFTRLQLQEEILRIWQAEQTTMILVTHDIDEAVFLADRVVILSDRPGTVRRIVRIDLERPRDRTSPDFVKLRSTIYREFFGGRDAPAEFVI
jgi:sulfonate transport system ATP-binding protein